MQEPNRTMLKQIRITKCQMTETGETILFGTLVHSTLRKK